MILGAFGDGLLQAAQIVEIYIRQGLSSLGPACREGVILELVGGVGEKHMGGPWFVQAAFFNGSKEVVAGFV